MDHVQLPADGAGKKLTHKLVTVSGVDYYAQLGAQLGSSAQDTFTDVGNGTPVNRVDAPASRYGLQVKGTDAAPDAWAVVLEVSLDGTNFTTVLTHNSGDEADGAVIWSGAQIAPGLYFRSRVVSLTLGSATNIVVTVVGV